MDGYIPILKYEMCFAKNGFRIKIGERKESNGDELSIDFFARK